MSFEYVKIGLGEEELGVVCDKALLPKTLCKLTSNNPYLATIQTRIKLTKISSGHFEALSDIEPFFDYSRPPDALGNPRIKFPVVKFNLEEVRYAVSGLIFEDANRIGKKLRRKGHQSCRPGKCTCPPMSVDDAIDWMQQTEKVVYHPRGKNGPELRGAPPDMHELLTTVLHDNINYQLFALESEDVNDSDDYQMS